MIISVSYPSSFTLIYNWLWASYKILRLDVVVMLAHVKMRKGKGDQIKRHMTKRRIHTYVSMSYGPSGYSFHNFLWNGCPLHIETTDRRIFKCWMGPIERDEEMNHTKEKSPNYPRFIFLKGQPNYRKISKLSLSLFHWMPPNISSWRFIQTHTFHWMNCP